ncbi:hypothetical protein K7432_006629 [Basidiobolus ranarum]|uniref:Uncharacterized protein n=1 Tax=Basidiobolus ranarum TaxID=34480 RepID=A0ABR2W1S7_9FUNG
MSALVPTTIVDRPRTKRTLSLTSIRNSRMGYSLRTLRRKLSVFERRDRNPEARHQTGQTGPE